MKGLSRMGNKASVSRNQNLSNAVASVVNSAKTQQSQTIPPVPNTTMCDVSKQQLSQLRGDVTKKESEVDNCSPEEARRRKQERITKEYNEFVSLRFAELTKESSEYRKNVQVLKNLELAKQPMAEYATELQMDVENANKELTQYERSIRAGRRRFLDNDPQEQVSSTFGIQTTDDKIMLAFWIAYLLLIVIVTFVFVTYYSETLGLDSIWKRIGFDFFLIATFYGIAYFFVYKFA